MNKIIVNDMIQRGHCLVYGDTEEINVAKDVTSSIQDHPPSIVETPPPQLAKPTPNSAEEAKLYYVEQRRKCVPGLVMIGADDDVEPKPLKAKSAPKARARKRKVSRRKKVPKDDWEDLTDLTELDLPRLSQIHLREFGYCVRAMRSALATSMYAIHGAILGWKARATLKTDTFIHKQITNWVQLHAAQTEDQVILALRTVSGMLARTYGVLCCGDAMVGIRAIQHTKHPNQICQVMKQKEFYYKDGSEAWITEVTATLHALRRALNSGFIYTLHQSDLTAWDLVLSVTHDQFRHILFYVCKALVGLPRTFHLNREMSTIFGPTKWWQEKSLPHVNTHWVAEDCSITFGLNPPLRLRSAK